MPEWHRGRTSSQACGGRLRPAARDERTTPARGAAYSQAGKLTATVPRALGWNGADSVARSWLQGKTMHTTMMRTTRSWPTRGVALLAVFALAACGGSGSRTPPTTRNIFTVGGGVA